MATFQAVELNNKYPTKDNTLKRDIKVMVGNATIYIPSDDTQSLRTIIKELNNAEPRRNR